MFGAISIAALPSSVWADAPLTDVARAPNAQDNSKFAGSYAEGSTYVAPSSFYTSGYRDPYVSLAFYVKPVYDLGTRYKLALTGRLYLEEELTQPDNPAGRHFYPYDLWVQLTAQNLHTFDSSKIRIGGYVRTVWPLSYESRYSHLVAAAWRRPVRERRGLRSPGRAGRRCPPPIVAAALPTRTTRSPTYSSCRSPAGSGRRW